MSRELKALKEIERNIKFFNENYDKIKERYRGKWVLIKNREVKLTGSSLNKIYKAIEKRKINIDGALIEYIPKKEEAWII